MYVGQKNPRFSYSMSNNGLQVVETEKHLGVMISSDVKCSRQCIYANKKAIRVNYGHFAYGTLYLLDSSPTRHFAYYLDSSPTDCTSFYQQDYQSKIKSDV